MKFTLALCFALLGAPAFAAVVPSGKQSAKALVFAKFFHQADADRDGLLNEAEFGRSYGASDTPVVTEYRFSVMMRLIAPPLRTHRSQPLVFPLPVTPLMVVFLDQFILQNGGRRLNPNRSERFLFADDNYDGFLDPEEFVATRVAPAATQGNIAKAFGKLDKNDDSLISPFEWGGFDDV